MDKPVCALLATAAVLAAGSVGASNGPLRPKTAVWYARLDKPRYTPPGPAIGAAWGVLELLLVGTGYRLLRAPSSGGRSAALGGWAMTLLGLAGYPWLFFGRKRLGSSTAAAGAMLVSASSMALAARRADPPSAAMSIPLVLWLGFATGLSEALWRRNPRLSRD